MSRTEHLLTCYKISIIEVNPDDPDDDIKTLSLKAREFLASKKYFDKPKVLQFYTFTKEFIENSIGRNFESKALLFKDLQNVFYKLEEYGIRLLKRPWRKEFYTIKLFTTFFKHDIESKLPNAVKILQLYGYGEVSQNMIKMAMDSLDSRSNRIIYVCFDLFLSRIELEVMSEICTTIEMYTSDFTLSDVFEARRKTKGDVNEAVEYFLRENPGINKVKRIKTDDTESGRKSGERFEKSNKLPSEDEETSRTDSNNGRITSQGRTKRDTKYPPLPGNYSNLPSTSDDPRFAAVTSGAKVRHISSSVPVDNFSDAELYGHDDASSSSQDNENNIPMDTQEPQARSGATYEPSNYVDMSGANTDYYQIMDQCSTENGLSSCTALPPPPMTHTYSSSDQGIPPPPYDQAIKIPGNDWVMIEDKDSDGLSNNISAMNIGENGLVSRTSNEVVGVRASAYDTGDIGRLKAASSDRIPYRTGPHYQTEPQGTSTKTKSVGTSGLREHSREVKGMGDLYSERPLSNGSHRDYRSLSTSFKKGFDGTPPVKSALNPFETPGDSTKAKTDVQRRSTLSGSYDRMSTSKATEEYLKDRLTRSGPEQLGFKRTSDPNVPTATLTYVTSSYPKRSSTTAVSYSSPSKTQSTMTTRSQVRDVAANKSDVMSEPIQGTSRTTQNMAERYSKENCFVCNSKATHYCKMCKKKSCKTCSTVITRLHCDSYKEHQLVEASPTINNEKADLGTKDMCSFCGVSAASHDCIYCNKKSCGNCHTIYTKDPCVLGREFHYFMDQQQPKSTSEKQETTLQKQTTLSLKHQKLNLVPFVTGENYCDFCALAANLICKICLKTICDKCKHVYTQDLCPPTKRDHQFENINEQSPSTNKPTDKDSSSSWTCERCTFLNSSRNRICAVCATSRGVNQVDLPKSGSRKCHSCTYANEEGATICKMCHCTVGLDNPESYI
ncbi:uncharacterized protein LOC116297826 [Actinia tenebrosa]|uniref:Uncharacterized protein LOC116297826 n=1 Tax=Actinia tenebrosa TaxID=6105 RepID=A0A6P8I9Y0_ACTTE|nr:uncharacterized protein LOC116297826 [Actinia tenebrosa]XP_031561992.1 uncharacterized protein LOC116297826 [Actinia tenebrosa]